MTHTPWLKMLAYIWAIFGAYWIVLAPWLARPRFYFELPPLVLIPSFVLLLWLRSAVPPPVLLLLVVSWTAVGLSWAHRPGNAARDEPSKFRFLRLAILGLTFALLFWNRTRIGALGKTVLPPAPAIALTGFVLVCCGLALAVWARAHLGRYWSDKVMLQLEHRLIESGPYTYVRHPIYSGVLLAVFGTALVEGELGGALAFLILLINYSIKAKREERVLAEHFRPHFDDYLIQAGFLLPRFRSRVGRS